MTLTMLAMLALVALIVIKVLHIGQHKAAAKQAVQDIAVRCCQGNCHLQRLSALFLLEAIFGQV